MDFQSQEARSAIRRITDVKVATVGLVSRAAVGDNGTNFVLRKNDDTEGVVEQEEVMTAQVDELVVEEATEDSGNSVIEALAKALAKLTGSNATEEAEVEAEVTEEVEVEKSEEADDDEALERAIDEKFTELAKAYDAKIEELTKSYNDRLTELQKAVSAKEAELTKADEELKKADWITKAADITNLPMASDAIGEAMYRLSKSAGDEHAVWVFDLLKAVDAQVEASGVLNELGSNKQEDELDLGQRVVKAQSDGNAAEALLSLSPEEQAEFIKTIRG